MGNPSIHIVVSKTHEGYFAFIDAIDGEEYDSEYSDMGVKDSIKSKSGWDALMKMAQNWKNAGFLD